MVQQLIVLLSLLLSNPVTSFVGTKPHSIIVPQLLASNRNKQPTHCHVAKEQDTFSPDAVDGYAKVKTTGRRTRREAILAAASSGMLAIMTLASTEPPNAVVAVEGGKLGQTPDSPIVVLGAGGKVGKLCTQILASKGLYVRATTRSGRQVLEEGSPYVNYAPCDVTNAESLKACLAGASGCIFAASASGKKKGGEPIGTFVSILVRCWFFCVMCTDLRLR